MLGAFAAPGAATAGATHAERSARTGPPLQGGACWGQRCDHVRFSGMPIGVCGRARDDKTGTVHARLFQVDAFTARPFAGNPAAVVLLEDAADERWMQQVAAEMNLSETAFVRRQAGPWQLRWFTPVTEVDLCGHATLASAHVLWELDEVGHDETISFETLSGQLSARRAEDGVHLDFPRLDAVGVSPPADLGAGLGTEVIGAWTSRHALIAEVPTPAVVAGLTPDLAHLRQLDTRSVIVTAAGDRTPFDFVSRVFAPAVGIDEDPVTGSAHCALGPLWAERLGRNRLHAYQASPRGGEMGVVVGDDRVTLIGQAVTVLRAQL